jgi:hypothetical protein
MIHLRHLVYPPKSYLREFETYRALLDAPGGYWKWDAIPVLLHARLALDPLVHAQEMAMQEETN